MVPLVEFPELVQHYAPFFKDVFSAEAFIEFERYISGLIVSENKTVDGINRLFVIESRNQSSLNRLLTESPFSLEALNQDRLKVMDSLPDTRMKPKGVLSVDDTLLTHYGQEFEQIAKLFDPATSTYVWAHNLVTIHYSDDLTDYPLLFRLWQPVDLEKLEQGLRAAGIPLKADKEVWKVTEPRKWRSYLLGVWQRRQKSHPEIRELYDSKLLIAQDVLQQWVEAHPDWKLPVTFDDWYTQPALCRFLDQTLDLPYVGTLSGSDKVNLRTGQTTLQDFAERLKQEHLEALQHRGQPVFRSVTISYKGEPEQYYSYCLWPQAATPITSITLANNGWSSIIARLTYRTTLPFSSACGYRQQPPGLAGRRYHPHPTPPLARCLSWPDRPGKSTTRKARQKGWISISYGISAASPVPAALAQANDMSPWSPWCTACPGQGLLRAAQHDPDLREQLQRQLKVKLEGSAASWRRVTQAQALWCLGLFISAGLAQGQSLHEVMAPLLRAICGS
jgi:hypothetical protein